MIKFMLIKPNGELLLMKNGEPFEYSLKRLAYLGAKYLRLQNGVRYNVIELEY